MPCHYPWPVDLQVESSSARRASSCSMPQPSSSGFTVYSSCFSTERLPLSSGTCRETPCSSCPEGGAVQRSALENKAVEGSRRRMWRHRTCAWEKRPKAGSCRRRWSCSTQWWPKNDGDGWKVLDKWDRNKTKYELGTRVLLFFLMKTWPPLMLVINQKYQNVPLNKSSCQSQAKKHKKTTKWHSH